MKIGDYARTTEGEIIKVRSYDEQPNNPLFEVINSVAIMKGTIIKSSSNIIDLIEVGDYVNGLQVYETGTFGHNGKTFCRLYGNVAPFYEDDIKSIVTKEQFKAMEYKIESEVN